MSDGDRFPALYEPWRHCIEVRGRTRRAPTFIDEKLSELEDASHPKMKGFARLCKADHLPWTIDWFRQGAGEHSETSASRHDA
ncbi:MAG: hypothetical protein AAGJ40_00660 [Planctomycetota bacterium]